ncbi:hypothetical protein BWR19_13715 [Halomonas sp. 1513]|nr:hypothetical protein [Halomonas sp. 1513]APX93909.1 hypothetical protein BWR19_13715 [Halomonas sp. 1513]
MTSSNRGHDLDNAGGIGDEADNESPTQKIEEVAREAKREAGDEAREKAQAGQHRLADEADALSDAIDAAASSLDDKDRDGLARFARELSSNLANAAGQLESRSVDELANDAKRLARDNPALYMLGSIAVGFGLSRFFKASAERDHDDDDISGNDDTSQDEYAYSTQAYRSDSISQDDASISTPGQRRMHDKPAMDSTSTVSRSGDERDVL